MDGVLVGYAYGARGIEVSLAIRVLVSAISGLVMLCAVLLGAATSTYLSPGQAKVAGGIILIIIGALTTAKGIRKRHAHEGAEGFKGPPYMASPPRENANAKTCFGTEKGKSEVIIRVMRDPEAADLDDSGSINSLESVLLGMALALDALGAGIGAGLTGLFLLIIPLAVGIGMFGALSAGAVLGRSTLKGDVFEKGLFRSVLPGILIMALGIASVACGFPR